MFQLTGGETHFLFEPDLVQRERQILSTGDTEEKQRGPKVMSVSLV